MNILKKEIAEQMSDGVVIEVAKLRVVRAEEVADKVFDRLTITECTAYLSGNAAVKDLIGKIVSFDKVDKAKELAFFNSYVDAVEPMAARNYGMEKLDKMVKKLFQENDLIISDYDSDEWWNLPLSHFWELLWFEISDNADAVMQGEHLEERIDETLKFFDCEVWEKEDY